MRVCIRKATGRLFEAQSFATPGTLLANVAAAGLDPADFEERDATDAEYAALLDAEKPNIDFSDVENVQKAIKARFQVELLNFRWSLRSFPIQHR